MSLAAQAVTTPQPEVELSREARLGVVLYGGVSLAIYINGVAHEFFRAVQGLGAYSLIKALTDSHVNVDIISGTSAGGINGLFLGFALCNQKHFGDFASLWREQGSIERLIRNPRLGPEGTNSVLDGEGYYQHALEDAFARLWASPEAPRGPLCWEGGELDLFITGTDIDGSIYTEFDDARHEIQVKDHRAVFLLKHRPGRKQPFDPLFGGAKPAVTFEALARLARITSCFPGAFPAVHVPLTPPGDESADAKLNLWGRLEKDAYYLDGGILDNKPFTHTIRAIFGRTATRPVRRLPYYVEPDPERFAGQVSVEQPNIFRSVLDSLIRIPGYESISGDLEMLRSHNSSVAEFERLMQALEADTEREPHSPAEDQTYRASRVVFFSRRAAEGVLKEHGRQVQFKNQTLAAAKKLIGEFESLTARLPVERMEQVDVYFRLRRLFDLYY